MTNHPCILVAIDLSTHTQSVLKCAKEFSAINNATLHLAHVLAQSPIAYGGEFSLPIDPQYEQTLIRQTQHALFQIAKTFDIHQKHCHLETGSVTQAIITLASKIHADMIIVGSHGHTNLDTLMGSQASAILNAATCDVLVIK